VLEKKQCAYCATPLSAKSNPV